MGEKKPTPEELAQRIDQLLVLLREILGDLADVSNTLKSVGAPTPTPVSAAPTPSAPPARIRSVADVRTIFPKELEDMLFFEENGEYIIIKPRRFLGSENFAKIASLVRSAGGEYRSAGKDSHFRVPRELR
jgi:hypothetical protein